MFALFNYIFGIAAGTLDGVIGLQIPVSGAAAIGILSTVYGLFIFVPSISLLFRRLHDINKSAWWILLCLIPVIGWIWIFVYTTMEGTRGANKYGENPKQ